MNPASKPDIGMHAYMYMCLNTYMYVYIYTYVYIYIYMYSKIISKGSEDDESTAWERGSRQWPGRKRPKDFKQPGRTSESY